MALPLLAIAADAGNWPQWRGPGRDGKSAETGLLKEWKEAPPLVYMTEGFGGGFASVSLADGKLFTTGNFPDHQALICANAADGSILWKTPISETTPKHDHGGSRCTPSLDGDRVYAISSGGAIYCCKIADGSVIWSHKFSDWKGKMMSGWGYSESPLVDGDRVLCTPGGEDAMVVCLNKMDGKEIWTSAVPKNIGSRGKDGAGYSSIVITNGGGVKQYVQLVGRGVIGLRATDGKYLWGYNGIANGVANIPTPIPFGDLIFTSTGYGDGGTAVLKLSSTGDEVKAEEIKYLGAKELQNHHGGMILLKDHIYFGAKHNSGFPVCVEAATAKVVWGNDARGEGSGSAAVTYADGNLIYRYDSGHVALVEATPTGYHMKGSFMPKHQEGKSWAHPVVAGGKLYLREQGKLMCYNLKP